MSRASALLRLFRPLACAGAALLLGLFLALAAGLAGPGTQRVPGAEASLAATLAIPPAAAPATFVGCASGLQDLLHHECAGEPEPLAPDLRLAVASAPGQACPPAPAQCLPRAWYRPRGGAPPYRA